MPTVWSNLKENRTNLKIKIIDARICNTSIISRWMKDGWLAD